MSALELLDAGYRPIRHPSPAQTMDIEIAEQMRCPRCPERPRMRWSGWQRPGSYVAQAVCPVCHYEQEF